VVVRRPAVRGAVEIDGRLMVEAKITAKGQITVPRAVREALAVGTGDLLEFEVEDGRAIVTPRRRGKLTELVGVLAVPAKHPAARRLRELRAKYSGQELIRRTKQLEEQAAIDEAMARDRAVRKSWRRRTSTQTSSSER